MRPRFTQGAPSSVTNPHIGTNYPMKTTTTEWTFRMRWLTKTRMKYTLAGVGILYLLLGIGLLVYAGVKHMEPSGPSELEEHPERQQEILARQRTEEMRTRLGLTDEQAKQIAEIMAANQPAGAQDGGDPRGRWRGLQEQIGKVLTPDQQQRAEQMRGQFAGKGGPRGGISPERMDALKEKMTPELRARFEKRMQDMQQRQGQRRGQQGAGTPGPPPPMGGGPPGPPGGG